MTIPRRSTTFYRVVLALPLLVLAYLVAGGRLVAYWRLFQGAMAQRPPGDAAFASAFVTALLWVTASGPLLYAAWEIGREHTAARRMNAEVLVGLREVVRRARGSASRDADAAAAEFARPPRDNPRAALAWGASVAVGLPAFFALGMPPLRTPGGALWLGVTGLLFGANIYCGRRAAAYLQEEPGRWDVFRAWRLLSPARYAEPARRLVRWQRVLAVLIPVWWLAGGAVVMSSR